MPKTVAVHESVVGPDLVKELESLELPDEKVSSFYLNLKTDDSDANRDGSRITLKHGLANARDQIDRFSLHPAARDGLRRDWLVATEAVVNVIGERKTRSLVCFVASGSRYGLLVRLPWTIRERAFYEDKFVVWPLRQLLEQVDRYAVVLTDKDESRLFLFGMEQIDEFDEVIDEIPGRIRFPDPYGELRYLHKHVEHVHRHFAKAAERALRLFEREHFQHLIIGGLWETLPQFENYLHRYLRDRVIARWDIDVHTPTSEIAERAASEERRLLAQQAQEIWSTIHEQRSKQGAIGPEAVFVALWQRRVQALLVAPGVKQPSHRCSVCGRLQEQAGRCVECQGALTDVPDGFDEAVHDAVEQSARVRYWKDPALKNAGSIAALSRF
jgi:hypothetical protein